MVKTVTIGMRGDSTTRSRIIAAAKRIFAEYGYEPASMSKIAARARIDKSSLYYFFRDKEDLFAAVTINTWHELSRSVIGNLASGKARSFHEALSKTCRDFIAIASDAGMSMTRMELAKVKGVSYKQTLGIIHKTQGEVTQFLKRHNIRQPQVAQSIISNAVHAFVIHTCTGKPQPSAKQYCDYLASLFSPNRKTIIK